MIDTLFSQTDSFTWTIYGVLFLFSVASWSLWIYFAKRYRHITRHGIAFQKEPLLNGEEILTSPLVSPPSLPERVIMETMRQTICPFLDKNRHFFGEENFLMREDIEVVAQQVESSIEGLHREWSRPLPLLSLITTLSPILGLLGTVWGILTTFQAMGAGGMGPGVITGLSTALMTTLVGLITAIPAIIAHHHLRKEEEKLLMRIRHFSDCLMGKIEIQYRMVNQREYAAG
ncbi:MAG: MotA/TolQ/ExbB proton channel family protein [Chlamydiota bacterium]|nr:MotA/TolQ/ExbB proton channel family protein [Chlamydiota bacterium]